VSYATALSLGREAILTAMLVAAPTLIFGMVTGLLISIFQAVTQIQEQTLTFIPKIIVVGLTILFFGPFMLAMLTNFTAHVFNDVGHFIQ
jgi:flagellar biosynthetic protein FliQ